MPTHRLDPLLRPCSIAVVGASERPGSPGNEAVVNLLRGGYKGELFLVNPSRQFVDGIACYASLEALPEIPEHVVFAVSDQRVEALLEQAISLGVKAATLFSPLQVANDENPSLKERVQARAQSAGLLLHGANCMGLFNFLDGVWLSGFDTREHRRIGNVALLSQSGAGMSGIVDCEERLGFCFAASTGQELCVSLEDYLDYVLDLPETKVVGLFLETSRHPQRFIAALEKARIKQIPIVVLKVGKTDLSAQLAVSHSGALAGSDATYHAVFERYGVQRVDDMAELATALIMFSHSPPVGEGGVVSLHDSGGERQLVIDLADALNVPMTNLSAQTVQSLEALLDEGLPAVNPLDAWGNGGEGAPQTMADCFTALLADSQAAVGAVIHDRAPGGGIYSSYLEYFRAGREVTGKPVFLVANHQGTGSDPAVVEASHGGIPVIDGLRQFLVGARCLLGYRDFLDRAVPVPAVKSGQQLSSGWQELLNTGHQLNEWQAGSLLRELGVPVLASEYVGSAEEVMALSVRYPVVLKTLAAGIAHKTEAGGVCLGVGSAQSLQQAYLDMSARLGPQALVAPMIEQEGVEMLLGVTRDAQFGPVVVVGFGGVHAEIYRDTTTLFPPFTEACVRRAISGLRFSALLAEVRGRPALAVDELCKVVVHLGEIALQLSQWVQEIDINPLLITPEACIGLDVLMTPVSSRGRSDGSIN